MSATADQSFGAFGVRLPLPSAKGTGLFSKEEVARAELISLAWPEEQWEPWVESERPPLTDRF